MATITLPVMGRAVSAEAFRRRLSSMDIGDVVHEIEEGDMLGGTRSIAGIEHVPGDRVGEMCRSFGSDDGFFAVDDWPDDQGDADHAHGSGQD